MVQLKSWRELREKTRQVNNSARSGYDLRLYYAARGLEKGRDEPAPVCRARGFAGIMENVPLHIYAEDDFAGSRRNFMSQELPGKISEAEYARAAEVYGQFGRRNFSAGNDHTLGDYSRLLAEGVGGIMQRLSDSRKEHTEKERQDYLDGVGIALDAFSHFIMRHADAWEESFPGDEYSTVLRYLATGAPRSLREAMQLVWLVHIAFVADFRGQTLWDGWISTSCHFICQILRRGVWIRMGHWICCAICGARSRNLAR